MALNDILVLLDSDDEAAGRYALWLAETLDAHLTAVSPIIEPRLPVFVSSEMPGEFLSKVREEAEDAARQVLSRFAEAAKQHKVAVEPQTMKALAGEVGREIRNTARYHDLTVLNQGDPEKDQSTEIIESTLFGSGRPILIVPYIFKEPGRLETVLVGWDGGPAAARALSDALPLLGAARSVQLVTVADASEEWVGRSHLALVRHLSHHRIQAEAKTLFGADDAASALLSHGADIGADLLVMGGYGHSRMREMVLGGATRAILRSMTLPVLMSH
jgi:nucleotide-binding universal stress UspA family protein